MAASKASALNHEQFQQLKKQESIAKPGLVDTPLRVGAGPCSI
ncbi:Signal transduction histidine kinase [Pseudomonas syringae pv. actinidiae]|uniref:Signal transduction histidine kinase n=1 Tax=Pseudomonas syringae pv. actinidiae TaxID=103796 RepID=A0A2V0QH93_PSESF|nr:Signal transduction histidine kinase [Pseudomonas syringae pv. actinidiae]